ncbi:MAG: U32 family peptidase [Candidatus Nanoarchaeia archaeon]|nr:U32 family peptidase [Candidatus Nanoarchaeia archaeon]
MIELLAPCHDWATLKAGIDSGANAVYFGINSLSMRMNAKDFKSKDLKKIAQHCHSNKAKAYLTLNSIIYENELKKSEKIIKQAKVAGIDAIIIQDLGLIPILKKNKMKFHISTQASASNSESANTYKKLGADRVILAREVSLKDLARIVKNSKIDLEVFIHGAMCASISGRCFLSGAIYNKSADRGECMQPCRQEWTVKNKYGELIYDNERFMNAKDLCTITFLDKIIKAGVKSLKIEGRMKDANYISTVVKIYRQAIDNYDKPKINSWLKELSKVYNRGFSAGFYLGKPTSKDIEYEKDGSISKTRKIPIGTVKNYYKRLGVAEIHLNHNDLSIDDEIIIEGKTTFLKQKIESIEINKKSVNKAVKGQSAAIKIKGTARKNDLIFKLSNF